MTGALRQENGHTIVEVLTALIILIIVILPAGSFFSNLIAGSQGQLLQSASQIAEEEMVSTLLNHDFRNDQRPLTPHLLLKKSVSRNGDLLTIAIIIESRSGQNRLLLLKRNYLLPENREGFDGQH